MSKLQSLNDIFNLKIFRVPDYQRGYSWEEKQLEELWDDIINISQNTYHFAGILTVERLNKNTRKKWLKEFPLNEEGLVVINDNSYTPFFIVDGQQRLVSLIMLISILIKPDRLKQLDIDKRMELKDKFVVTMDNGRPYHLFGYEKDTPSHQYLIGVILEDESMVVTEPETVYTSNLDVAKQFLDGKVRQLDDLKRKEILNNVIHNLLFNVFEIESDKTDISLVFETLNYRGKKLSKLELFKNRLIFLLTKRGYHNIDFLRDKIVKTWQDIYEWLGKEQGNTLDDDEFLKAFWIMFFNHDNLKDDAFNLFEHDIFNTKYRITNISKNSFLSESQLHLLLDNLTLAVRHWFYINIPDSRYSNIDEESKKWLVKIKRNTYGKHLKPIIMAAFKRSISSNDMVKLLKEVERHNFLVYFLAGKQSDTNRPHFYRLTNRYFREEAEFKHVDLLRELKEKAEEHVTFQNIYNHIHRNRSNNSRFLDWNGCRYFFWELEENLRGNRDQILQSGISGEIDVIFPDPGYQLNKSFPEVVRYRESESIKKLCFSLGNLVITKRISQPLVYSKRHEKLLIGTYTEREVAGNCLKWTDVAILERGKHLISFMEKRWAIRVGDDEQLEHLLLDGVRV